MANSRKLEITIDFVMIIISFAAFVFFTILGLYELAVNWLRILYVFIPVVVFAGVYFLHIKYRKETLFIIVNVILIIIFVLFYMYQLFCFFFVDMDGIRNPSGYQQALSNMGYPTIETEHFPSSIPNSVSNVRLYQADNSLYLRYTIDEKEINNLYSRYKNVAKYIISISNNYIPEPIQENEASDYNFPLPGNISYYIDDLYSGDYDVLILDCAPEDLEHPDFVWNHGYSYGLMINREKYDVIYWSENW